MEAIEELLIPSISESTKVGVVSGETEPVAMELDVCHKSNGVADSTEAGYSESDGVVSQSDARDSIVCDQRPAEENVPAGTSVVEGVEETAASLGSDIDLLAAISETASAVENLLGNSNPSETSQEITEEIVENHEEIVSHGAEIILEESTVEMDHVESETVTFTTEILVEKNDYHSSVDPIVQQEVVTSEQETTNNILNDLGHGIELSEALRSSDTADNAENNNCTTREEVFNKEELLDILEGNDMTQSDDHSKETKHTNSAESKKNIEAQMAWKQLSKLKQTRNCRPKRKVERTPTIRKKRDCKKERISDSENSNSKENSEKTDKNSHMQDEDTKTVVVEKDKNKSIVNNEKDKNVSIVNKLVEDWDDDEPPEADQTTLDVSDKLDEACNDLVKSLEAVTSQEVITTTCSLTTNDQTVNVKSEDESQPQRRLGRVIKKKVIFDPDNPDTFTKGKVVAKTKETNPEKEQPPPKKIKSEEITQRSKSKSPMSKMQWKKPQPKINSKQNKTRLTEVDKLLMDEGAVNMIYQLTPEAPKGKKNMRTKAEFIKKIQSSTPEGKEGSRFRERKKEVKMEESEAKKILGGKQRSSLSSSVKSPAACEDFENISADDSIIYRRHSSSSYSSTCMSPRRLSDVDAGALQSVAKASQQAADTRDTTLEATIPNQSADIFMADANSSAAEIINKDDCLSIKEKLNTKLSQALKKRKRDSTKIEKTPKLKRVIKTEEKDSLKNKDVGGFNHLTIRFNQRLAQICIMKKFSNVEVCSMKIKHFLINIQNKFLLKKILAGNY